MSFLNARKFRSALFILALLGCSKVDRIHDRDHAGFLTADILAREEAGDTGFIDGGGSTPTCDTGTITDPSAGDE